LSSEKHTPRQVFSHPQSLAPQPLRHFRLRNVAPAPRTRYALSVSDNSAKTANALWHAPREAGKRPRFAPGNPGRPKGLSGRSAALARFDAVCKNKRNLSAIEKALSAECQRDPLAFWKDYIVPLLPKGIQLEQWLHMDVDVRADVGALAVIARALHDVGARSEGLTRMIADATDAQVIASQALTHATACECDAGA